MDQNARQQIIDRLKDANNVLVTVSTNPSVDQLAACIGFTLLLNHLGKHGTAVFSGTIPSTIEFLKPEETLEKNTDSLRDFIIALDKSKADKLRYKVEDTVVKIFITPYRTSLSDKDLEFSQGDFNVDAVVALGVRERADIDKAIMAHGRILHDATVISINNHEQSDVGAVNLIDIKASSLSEMLVELGHALTPEPFDPQMATAFMTGIVAETDRFSNTKTSPRTMSIASDLMAAGANQQLIASKLEDAQPIPQGKAADVQEDDQKSEEEAGGSSSADGSLQIDHDDGQPKDETKDESKPLEPAPEQLVDKKDDEIDNILNSLATPSEDSKLAPPQPPVPLPPLPALDQAPAPEPSSPAEALPPSTAPKGPMGGSSMALQPPIMGGQLTANSEPEHLQADPSTDPLTLPSINAPQQPQILNRPTNLYGTPVQPATSDLADQKLSSIEQTVASPHLDTPNDPLGNDTPADPGDPVKAENVIEAREAVDQAIAADAASQPLEPIQALGAHPVNLTPEPAEPAPLPSLAPLAPPVAEPAPLPAAPAPAPAPFAPYQPPAPAGSPAPAPAPAPFAPFPSQSPTSPTTPSFPGSDPLAPPPDTNGVNPNNPSVPSNLMPLTPPTDPTASTGNASPPPPVPPPLMPPMDSSNSGSPL